MGISPRDSEKEDKSAARLNITITLVENWNEWYFSDRYKSYVFFMRVCVTDCECA